VVLTEWHSPQPSQSLQVHRADHGSATCTHHHLQVPSNLVVLELGSGSGSGSLLDDAVVEVSCCVVVLVSTIVVVVLSSAVVVLISAVVVLVSAMVVGTVVMDVVDTAWSHSEQPMQCCHVHLVDHVAHVLAAHQDAQLSSILLVVLNSAVLDVSAAVVLVDSTFVVVTGAIDVDDTS